MLAHLSADMAAALAAGDIETAALAHAMIGKLIAAQPGEGAAVVDLAEERRRRER